MWDGVSGLSMALGPVVGGILVGTVGWRGIFWANIPVGLAAIAMTALLVPDSRAPKGRRADPLGQILVIAMLASLAYAIIQGPANGWFSIQTLGFFLVSVTALLILVRYEPRRRGPADRPALLQVGAVQRGQRHRRLRDRGQRRVPVPDHALPAGRARLQPRCGPA